MIYETISFHLLSVFLTLCFLAYGMDVRRREGSRNLAPVTLQLLMKLCSFALIGGYVVVAVNATIVGLPEWLGSAFLFSGVIFVAQAKRALGKAHTFTGQCLANPSLVTTGIYRFTRNPLYFGVFQCELGAAIIVVRQLLLQFPQAAISILLTLTPAILFAISFNVAMARKEAKYLESYFGGEYRAYSRRVPFLIPSFKSLLRGV